MQFRGRTASTTTRLRSLEGEDTIEDGEVIGISAEDQLKLRALRIKNNHLQKQKEILEAKRKYLKPSVNESLCKPKCDR